MVVTTFLISILEFFLVALFDILSISFLIHFWQKLLICRFKNRHTYLFHSRPLTCGGSPRRGPSKNSRYNFEFSAIDWDFFTSAVFFTLRSHRMEGEEFTDLFSQHPFVFSEDF